MIFAPVPGSIKSEMSQVIWIQCVYRQIIIAMMRARIGRVSYCHSLVVDRISRALPRACHRWLRIQCLIAHVMSSRCDCVRSEHVYEVSERRVTWYVQHTEKEWRILGLRSLSLSPALSFSLLILSSARRSTCCNRQWRALSASVTSPGLINRSDVIFLLLPRFLASLYISLRVHLPSFVYLSLI